MLSIYADAGQFVRTIDIPDPQWPWWIIGCSVLIGIIGFFVLSEAPLPKAENIGLNIIIAAIIVFFCGFIAFGLIDADKQNRWARAISNDLKYDRVIIFEEGTFTKSYTFTAVNAMGIDVFGDIHVGDDTITIVINP